MIILLWGFCFSWVNVKMQYQLMHQHWDNSKFYRNHIFSLFLVNNKNHQRISQWVDGIAQIKPPNTPHHTVLTHYVHNLMEKDRDWREKHTQRIWKCIFHISSSRFLHSFGWEFDCTRLQQNTQIWNANSLKLWFTIWPNLRGIFAFWRFVTDFVVLFSALHL